MNGMLELFSIVEQEASSEEDFGLSLSAKLRKQPPLLCVALTGVEGVAGADILATWMERRRSGVQLSAGGVCGGRDTKMDV